MRVLQRAFHQLAQTLSRIQQSKQLKQIYHNQIKQVIRYMK